MRTRRAAKEREPRIEPRPECLVSRPDILRDVAPIPAARTTSVVVPVYNSASSLQMLVDRLRTVLGPIVAAFEIVLINDASRDDSWQVIDELSKLDSRVRGIDLARNH